jgi:capsular polysaccharide biosynthesis protein
MEEQYEEINLTEYLLVIWKRKWMIIIPTFLCVIATAVISFILPQKWEVDAIVEPSKMFIQNQQGEFKEVVVTAPDQIAGQINEESYDRLIAAELKLDLKEYPELKAETIRNTHLVRISIREQDVTKAQSILTTLFKHLKVELDRKVDVEMKGIDAKIIENENLIKLKEFNIKDALNEIELQEIEKVKMRQEISSAENKVKISDERGRNILEEMSAVKKRIDEIEVRQKEALAQIKEGSEAISLLLYFNEVQNNLRYMNILDEKLSNEKIIRENLDLLIKERKESIRMLDTEIAKLNTAIDKIKNEIDDTRNDIGLLEERKGQIDYAELVKEPTPSISPVSPRKMLNTVIAGFIGLIFFTILVFLIENVEKHKEQLGKSEGKSP